ncbi:MAG TPA: hypothetical protein VH878_08805 [Thermodesulfobacteriota bacterium]
MTEQGVQSLIQQSRDLVQQSLTESGVIEGASAATGSSQDELQNLEEELGIHQPLQPPEPDYEDVSSNGSFDSQVNNQASGDGFIQTPHYNLTPGRTRVRSCMEPQRQPDHAQESGSVPDGSDVPEGAVVNPHEVQSKGIVSARRSFQLIASEAGTTLPLMEMYEGTEFDETDQFRLKANEAANSAKDAIDFLLTRSIHSCDLETQVNDLRRALNSQRAVIQNFRDKCESVFSNAESVFHQEMSSTVYSQTVQALEVKKYKAANVQLQATVAAKDAEILLLQEQLKQKKCDKCSEAVTESQPGPSVIRSPKRPRIQPYKPYLKSDILLSMRTPRREQGQE